MRVPVFPWRALGGRETVRTVHQLPEARGGIRSRPMDKEQNTVSDTAGRRSVSGLVGVLSTDFAALSATRLLSVAVPWFVLVTTGSVAMTGLVAFFQIVRFVISQPLVGPLIDRIGPRRVSIGGDLLSMTALVVIGALHAAGVLSLWALIALLAVQGSADGPAVFAKSVLIPPVD